MEARCCASLADTNPTVRLWLEQVSGEGMSLPCQFPTSSPAEGGRKEGNLLTYRYF